MVRYVIAAIAALVCHAAISLLIRRFGWRKENFKGQKIPSVFGLYIVAYGAIGSLLGRYGSWGSDPAARLYLVTVLGFGLLGLADDLLGSRDVGGFRGHFKKLLLERRLTTGTAKAIGGGLIAVYVGYKTSGGAVGLWALDAAVIALGANAMNLLDVRPGRTLFVFFLGLLLTAAATWGRLSAPAPVLAAAAAAGGTAYYDACGKAMLGDVGSNALGAVLGLTLALDVGLVGRTIAAALFLAINICSERRSISELIEHHPVLAHIDSKLGVR
jgi:UDP-N-acetylmuramyl pentapeptide phosphotransferase/UDP-N-acetylglucosamine-1-phosphate transferase